MIARWLLVALFLLLSGHAWSQSCYYATNVGGVGQCGTKTGQWASFQAAANAYIGQCPGWTGYASATCQFGGTPDANHLSDQCPMKWNSDGTSAGQLVVGASAQACPVNPCANLSGLAGNVMVCGGSVPTQGGSAVQDGVGCTMSVSSTSTAVSVGGSSCTMVNGVYTGSQVPSDDPAPPPKGQAGDCTATGSGGFACSEANHGKNCGTFNGDEVCPQSIPPGTCVSFESGGVACTTSSTPPAPNNGTPGQPAAPTGKVSYTSQDSSGHNVTTTTNYYSSTVVNASSGGSVDTNGSGANVGNGNNGTGIPGKSTGGSGAGGGSSPSSANGDCGASGVDCGGDGSVPQLPSEPTLQQAAQTYYAALASVPVVAAVGGIAAAVPDGQCPTASFSVFGQQYTLDVQCTLWNSMQGVLSAVMLVFWTILGVRVLMSA